MQTAAEMGQGISAADFAGRGQAVARRQPQGGVAAGGMTDDNNARKVEWMSPGQVTEVVRRRAPIEEGAGPATSSITYLPILDVPSLPRRFGRGPRR